MFSLICFKLKTINQTSTWMDLNDHSSYHRALTQFNRHKIHVLHENNALIFKIHHTVLHCFNMFMRILTLKYSASFGITSSMIILEQRTLASPSLFKHCFWGHFLGSWKNVRDSVLTRHIFCCHSVHCCKSMDSEIHCILFSPHWTLFV